MTKEQLYNLLKTLELPIAYHHFDTKQPLPFIAYIDIQKQRYLADNKVYWKDSKYRIELYYEDPNRNLEVQLENLLDEAEIVWVDEEPIYIEDEEIFLKIYYI